MVFIIRLSLLLSVLFVAFHVISALTNTQISPKISLYSTVNHLTETKTSNTKIIECAIFQVKAHKFHTYSVLFNMHHFTLSGVPYFIIHPKIKSVLFRVPKNSFAPIGLCHAMPWYDKIDNSCINYCDKSLESFVSICCGESECVVVTGWEKSAAGRQHWIWKLIFHAYSHIHILTSHNRLCCSACSHTYNSTPGSPPKLHTYALHIAIHIQ